MIWLRQLARTRTNINLRSSELLQDWVMLQLIEWAYHLTAIIVDILSTWHHHTLHHHKMTSSQVTLLQSHYTQLTKWYRGGWSLLLVKATITAASNPTTAGITTSGTTPPILISPTTCSVIIRGVVIGGAIPLVMSTMKHGDITQWHTFSHLFQQWSLSESSTTGTVAANNMLIGT